MKDYQFEIIPLPKGLFAELNMLPGMALEVFSDGSRIIVQKSDSEERCCDDYGEDCDGCPYCCSSCGECLWKQINRVKYGEDDND